MALANLEEMVAEKGIDNSAVMMLLDHGKRAGYLTTTEIIDCIPDAEWDEELRASLINAFHSEGIQYIEDSREDVYIDEAYAGEEQEVAADFSELEMETVSANLDDVDTGDMLQLYIKEASQTPLLTYEQEVELARRIELGRAAQQKLAKTSSASKRKQLEQQIQQARQARERLISANARLVISVARKYLGRGLPFLDLIQEGNIGLMRAVRNFDYKRGFKFSTYATWWIRQAVTRSLAEQSRTIRLPVHMSDQVGRMLREQNRLHQLLGRKPNPRELAEALNITPDKVEHMLDVVRQPLSLQTPVGEEDDEVLGDFVEDPAAGDPEEMVSDILMNEELDKMLENLPQREFEVLQMRYGLHGEQPLTLNEVGSRLGITRERVRQLELQAIERLRNPNTSRRKSAGEKSPGQKKD